MIFLTYWFLYAAGVFFPLYWVVRNAVARRVLLLLFCVVFHYHFAGPAGVLPIVVLGVVTYFAGLSRRGWACVMGIGLSALGLLFYKYTQFLSLGVLGWVHGPWGEWTWGRAQEWLPGAPPLAISFFVFEFIHYLYDVRGGSAPIRKPWDFMAFAIFWPSIVAGPVKRYEAFIPSLKRGLEGTSQLEVAVGMMRVAVGLVKKFVADGLTTWIGHYVALQAAGSATNYSGSFGGLTMGMKWAVFAAIGLRILLDFSGYSDMALGFARMMGVRLPENFNWPYLATSLTDFWRRWHMSLSSWIRDYVYIPLGGGRHGVVRKAVNGLAAFALCGLWHGPTWNFVLWGVYHGVGLSVSSSLGGLVRRMGGERVLVWLKPVTWVATGLFVGLGWLMFFYPLGDAYRMAKMLFGGHA